jgi:hypothetical protein
LPATKMDPETLAVSRIVRILKPLDAVTRGRVSHYLYCRYASDNAKGVAQAILDAPIADWKAPWEKPPVPPTAPLTCPHGVDLGGTCVECAPLIRAAS